MDTKQLVKYFLSKHDGEREYSNDVHYFLNRIFGDFAITDNGKTFLEDLAEADKVPFGFICKIIATTVENSRNGFRSLWACKGDTLPSMKKSAVHYLEDYTSYQIRHSEKPQKIMELLASKAINFPFNPIPFTEEDCLMCEMPIFDEAYPWLGLLVTEGLIIAGEKKVNPNIQYSILTPKGWRFIEEQRLKTNSNKVFIAMPFGIPNRAEIQNAIEEGCRENGFEAKTVDQEQFNGKITDKIIAAIKESQFIVSEFSSQNHGVYFESGFAEGLGKTVIYCVHSADIDNLHFDTAQTNHIVWENYVQLREKINDRIKATIL